MRYTKITRWTWIGEDAEGFYLRRWHPRTWLYQGGHYLRRSWWWLRRSMSDLIELACVVGMILCAAAMLGLCIWGPW